MERRLVRGFERAHLFENEVLFEGGKHWLDGRWLQEIGRPPLAYQNFAQAGRRVKLARDRHNHDIRFGEVVGTAADDDGWPLLRCYLIRKWESDEHYVPELIGHRKRRLPGYSRPPRTQAHSPQRQRGSIRVPVPAHGEIPRNPRLR